jgi:nitrogen fixation NifU-like protein
VDHVKNPRHQGILDGPNVIMPGGSPECGGSVTIYLKGGEDGRIVELSWIGEGDTLSMGAASIITERVHGEGLGMDDVLALDYEDFVESIGREVVGSRTRHATLGLSTVKSAIRRYQRDLLKNDSAKELRATEIA